MWVCVLCERGRKPTWQGTEYGLRNETAEESEWGVRLKVSFFKSQDRDTSNIETQVTYPVGLSDECSRLTGGWYCEASSAYVGRTFWLVVQSQEPRSTLLS